MSHQLSTAVGVQGVDGTAGLPLNAVTRGGGQRGLKPPLVGVDTGLKDSLVCLTFEELQQILNTVKTPINGQNGPEEQREQGPGNDVTANPTCCKWDAEDDKLCVIYFLGDQTDLKSVSSSSVNEERREIREEDKRGGEELMNEGGCDATRSSQEKENG